MKITYVIYYRIFVLHTDRCCPQRQRLALAALLGADELGAQRRALGLCAAHECDGAARRIILTYHSS